MVVNVVAPLTKLPVLVEFFGEHTGTLLSDKFNAPTGMGNVENAESDISPP